MRVRIFEVSKYFQLQERRERRQKEAKQRFSVLCVRMYVCECLLGVLRHRFAKTGTTCMNTFQWGNMENIKNIGKGQLQSVSIFTP